MEWTVVVSTLLDASTLHVILCRVEEFSQLCSALCLITRGIVD